MTGALILAGGGSSRMGRDKASLEIAGQSLLGHVLASVSPACSLVVVAARAAQVLPVVSTPIVRVDDPPSSDARGPGPLVGIVGGLEQLAARGVERAYLGSCDALGLSAAHVEFMLARLEREARASLIVVRDVDARLHPLASALRVGPLLEHSRVALARGERRLQRVFGSVEPRVELSREELPDPEVLEPCNTPAELEALRQRLATRAQARPGDRPTTACREPSGPTS